MDIVLTVVITMMLLLLEHYLPWKLMTGKELPRLVSYVMGALSIAVPLTVLGYVWIINGSGSLQMLLAALWILLASGGLTISLASLVDNVLSFRLRLTIRENEANNLRPGFEYGAKKK